MNRRWPQNGFRFSLRSFFLAITCLSVSLAALVGWWTRPFVVTGSHPNGTRAWEQWERRTVLLKYQHIKTVRYYSNGQKGMEFVSRDGSSAYWSPDGKRISEEEWFTFFDADGGETQLDPKSVRPSKRLLYWWNGW